MLQRRLTSSSFRSHGQELNVDVEIAGMNNKKNPHDNSVLTYLSRNIDINRNFMTARANQITGLTNGRAANWAPEVVFSPFRALFCRQLTFSSCSLAPKTPFPFPFKRLPRRLSCC